MRKLNEREIAVDILSEIIDSKAYNNIALRKALDNAGPDIRKGFVTELVNGVLRNLIFIDYVINLYSKTPVPKMKRQILSILRAGVYQLFFMDGVPDSAAVDEAVKQTRAKGFNNLCGFVNAVLRNIAKNKSSVALPDREKESLAYSSVKYSYPEWMLNRWTGEMSEDELKNLLEANAKPPGITVCVNTLKTSEEELIELFKSENVAAERGKLHENALSLSNTADITGLAGFGKGLFHVIGESSMLAVDALTPEPGCTMLDVCAAPGGKSFYAAMLMKNRGKIISRDIHEHKIKLLSAGALRLGTDIIRPELADASVFNIQYEETMDRLLIDAPCSGLGLIGKRPDIKLTKTEEDIRKLSLLQRQILSACHKYLKIGGVMVYSTCTLTPEENMKNIEWFIKEYGFKLDPLPFDYKGIGKSEAEGCLTIMPGKAATDGFFIARLVRERQ